MSQPEKVAAVPAAPRERVRVFDTTLRDGEQAPGFSMSRAQKLRVAHALAELGVDVIEAGFPQASDGDFDAVRAVATEVRVRARLSNNQTNSKNPAPGNRGGVFLCPWMDGMPKMQEQFSAMDKDA